MIEHVTLKDVPVYIRKNRRGYALHVIIAAHPDKEDKVAKENLKQLSLQLQIALDKSSRDGWKDYVEPAEEDALGKGIVAPIYLRTMRYDKHGEELNVTYDSNGNPRGLLARNYAHYISAKISDKKSTSGILDFKYKADVLLSIHEALIDNVRHLLVHAVDFVLKNEY